MKDEDTDLENKIDGFGESCTFDDRRVGGVLLHPHSSKFFGHNLASWATRSNVFEIVDIASILPSGCSAYLFRE
ncbi:hypothetical protein TorRG33x02_065560 [Trema orientale]|uniref:Uncharacterized protein n=1 Tax=Trema orientale TaxID=63057 RepID=A0A2P5FIP9_TREOI|nr:hypothetical protein TorRG33x02_065560 [Trema orientale]